jgi:hypothetical protein
VPLTDIRDILPQMTRSAAAADDRWYASAPP